MPDGLGAVARSSVEPGRSDGGVRGSCVPWIRGRLHCQRVAPRITHVADAVHTRAFKHSTPPRRSFTNLGQLTEPLRGSLEPARPQAVPCSWQATNQPGKPSSEPTRWTARRRNTCSPDCIGRIGRRAVDLSIRRSPSRSQAEGPLVTGIVGFLSVHCWAGSAAACRAVVESRGLRSAATLLPQTLTISGKLWRSVASPAQSPGPTYVQVNGIFAAQAVGSV